MSLTIVFWTCFIAILLLVITRTPKETIPVFVIGLLAILAVVGAIT
jgi:hypothetical protein